MTVLYAATGSGVGRLESRNGWSVTLTGPPAQAIAADPARPEELYAGCRGDGLWRSDDGARTWRQLDFPQPDVFAVAVSPVDGAVYAGCEPSMLFVSRDGGASWLELESLRRLPSAPTWSFPPRPWTSHVRWIAPSPHDDERLLVGIELGGVMLSEDGGETFVDHRPGAQPDVHALAWHPAAAGRAYEAGGGGAAWSRDGGWTWVPADDGRDRHYTWALAVDPGDPERWYISAAAGPRAAHGAANADARLYRWQASGPWERLTVGLPDPLDSMPYALLAVGEELYAALRDGRLYRSDDRGDSWHAVPVVGDELPAILALAAGS